MKCRSPESQTGKVGRQIRNPKSAIRNFPEPGCGNQRAAHTYTLLMTRSCPWCLEPIPVDPALPECPHCGRPLGEEGESKARELRFDRVEGAQAARFRRMLAWGAPIMALIAVAMPLVHVGALAVVPLLVAVHLVLVRVVLVRDAQRLLGPVRRLLNRWLARFSFLWIGLPGYGAMTVPVIGVLVGVGTFAVLTSLVHISTMVSLQRERSGRKLARWEKLVPIVLAVLSIGFLVIAISIAVLFGWSIMAIVDRMQTP